MLPVSVISKEEIIEKLKEEQRRALKAFLVGNQNSSYVISIVLHGFQRIHRNINEMLILHHVTNIAKATEKCSITS